MHKQFRYLIAVLIAFALPAPASQWRFDDVERVVAIADIHGAYGPMVKALQNADVIDENLTWTAAGSHLVIVGDILDRGPDSREAMDLLMRLEVEAAAAGGKVHVLIGNHEAMNLIGDLRYVSAEEYEAFADDEMPEDRERWFAAYNEYRASGSDSDEARRVVFNQKYPVGYFAHRRAFSSTGKYGAWLLSKPLVVVINGTAFVHGGLSPMIGDIGLDGVNGKLRDEMAEYVRQAEILFDAGALLPMDNFFDHVALLNEYMPRLDASTELLGAIKTVKALSESEMHALDGPLWYRGNVVCSELIETDKLVTTLDAIDADRVVIGHTPTPGRRVLERLGGRVVEIDTGMLNDYYGGVASVLIIEDGRLAFVTETSGEELVPETHPREVGMRPDAPMSAADIEQLLRSGDVISAREDEFGRPVVTVSDGKRTLEAFFAKRDGRDVYLEVAAYRLDRLLGLEMVPVAVKRDVDGASGSLQFRPRNWIDELARARDGLGGAAWCPLSEQWNAMLVFDILTYNAGRTGRTVLYNLDMWQVMLIGHDRAFVARQGKPKQFEDVPFTVSQAWKDALATLTDEVLDQQFSDVLDKRRLRALKKRRDALLQQPEESVAAGN